MSDDVIWINFDAWKYHDKKDLWEGFILDVADHFGKKKEILKRITGKDTKSSVVDVGTDLLESATNWLPELLSKITTIDAKIPKLDFIDKLTSIFKSSPITRVFQLQEILKYLLSKKSFYSKMLIVQEILEITF